MRTLTIKTSANILINFVNYIKSIILLLYRIFDLLTYKMLEHKVIIMRAKNFISRCCVFRDINCETLT